MNWLKKAILPRIKFFRRQREAPDDVWSRCLSCGHIMFQADFISEQYVCPKCQHHARIDALSRFSLLFDGGYEVLSLIKSKDRQDPLKFQDTKSYKKRLSEACKLNYALEESVSVGVGTLQGHKAVMSVQNFSFMGGSMGMSAGESIVLAARKALETASALITICSSGGMRMQEGVLSLMQMPRTTIGITRLKEAGLPYISVLSDPTTGGVTASFATLGDITLAEPGALIGFAGPRVIQQTINTTLPPGFQRAEYLYERGMIDQVVHRHDLKNKLANFLHLFYDKSW